MNRYRYTCEVCLRTEILSADEAFDQGWDVPPRVGVFGVISPRLCPKCPTPDTVWWLVMMECRSAEALPLIVPANAPINTPPAIGAAPKAISAITDMPTSLHQHGGQYAA